MSKSQTQVATAAVDPPAETPSSPGTPTVESLLAEIRKLREQNAELQREVAPKAPEPADPTATLVVEWNEPPTEGDVGLRAIRTRKDYENEKKLEALARAPRVSVRVSLTVGGVVKTRGEQVNPVRAREFLDVFYTSGNILR